MAKLISKTYGEALFELAVEESKVDAFMEEIEELRKILSVNPEFGNLMNHPKIMKEEKIQVMENVLKGRISDELTGFFSLILIKDRYRNIDSILTYFLDRVKERKGIGVAYVTTAVSLKETRKQQIEQKLLDTAGFQSMEMHYNEDTELIGGMVIRIGDRVVDSSIRTKLRGLERQLMKLQLSM